MLKVNIEKCIGCAFCVTECPSQILKIVNGKASLTQDSLCIDCGHCAAICPSNSIVFEYNDDESKFSIRQILKCENPVESLLRTKRSIRSFKEESISSNDIEDIITSGELAPSAHNNRLRKYYIIRNKDRISTISSIVVNEYRKLIKILNPAILIFIRIITKDAWLELTKMKESFKHLISEFDKGNDTVFRNPSHIICVAAPAHSNFSRDDCIASQHYMMIFAKSKGIDSFIVGFAQWAHKKIEKYLNVPLGYSIFAISVFGFSKYVYKNEVVYSKAEVKYYD